MAQFRKALPQLSGEFFLTDGGIETTLIFLERLELPDFAAFDLLKRKEGEAVLRKYFQTYSGLAQRFGHRAHSRKRNVARQLRLGRKAGLQRQRDGRGKSPCHCAA